MNPLAMQDRIDPVARALADTTRRSLLLLVRDREVAAGDLAAEFPHMSRPAVSQHLKVLYDAGLVSTRSEGNRRMYHARKEGLSDVRDFVNDMWIDNLARLKDAAEGAERQASRAGSRTASPQSVRLRSKPLQTEDGRTRNPDQRRNQ